MCAVENKQAEANYCILKGFATQYSNFSKIHLPSTQFRTNYLVGIHHIHIFICAFPSLYTLLIGKERQNDREDMQNV